jgi:hypothetical protein
LEKNLKAIFYTVNLIIKYTMKNFPRSIQSESSLKWGRKIQTQFSLAFHIFIIYRKSG